MSTDEVVGPRLRAVLTGLPRYVPGRPAGAAEDGRIAYKISSNENPYPPLPSVLEVVARAAQTMNRYPDMACLRLVAAVAEHIGVPAECVVPGTGSVGALGHLVQSVCDENDEIVYAWRSFEAYPIVTQVCGARPVPVPLTPDARHDLPAMAAAITDRTRMVLVCSPNNPTGPAVHAEELESFLDRVPPGVLVVLDEAYVEFVRDEKVPDGVELWRHRPNLAVLRTFSKAYGLAGLRVGYALCSPAFRAAVDAVRQPFSVNAIAQAAAGEAVRHQDDLIQRVERTIIERVFVEEELRSLGLQTPDSQTNFSWVALGERDEAAIVDALADQGILVRPGAALGGPGHFRVSYGTRDENLRFIAALRELL
jgi:histidinol-phosphate aminotransferase